MGGTAAVIATGGAAGLLGAAAGGAAAPWLLLAGPPGWVVGVTSLAVVGHSDELANTCWKPAIDDPDFKPDEKGTIGLQELLTHKNIKQEPAELMLKSFGDIDYFQIENVNGEQFAVYPVFLSTFANTTAYHVDKLADFIKKAEKHCEDAESAPAKKSRRL